MEYSYSQCVYCCKRVNDFVGLVNCTSCTVVESVLTYLVVGSG